MKQTDKQKYNTEETLNYEEWKISDSYRKSKDKSTKNTFIIAACLLFSTVIGGVIGTIVPKNSNALSETNMVINVTETPDGADEYADAAAQEEGYTPSAGITPASQENDLINIIAEARKNGMTKRAYLTFDDGPSGNVTGAVLDILKNYNVKATFFEVGEHIKEYPQITKRVHDEGHLVANHSYSHDYNALYATEESFAEEIRNTEKAITETIGEAPSIKLMRFPGGSYNAGDHAAQKQVYKKTLANMGYYFCDWNTLNGDAEGAEKNSFELVEFFKSNTEMFIEQDKNVIVLMHDFDTRWETVNSLESIIVYLRDRGYTFHRLDDIR